ncbi:MAG TPA: TetR/AcrR family transcriptional regulator [Candidatus Dormibacteraeota bacterium]|nr:TetR/AcrR family transcriptional regulator [Candidatus Dormibacteraeota bacterium]
MLSAESVHGGTTAGSDSTEKRILSAALRLFASKGYGAVGIREIAQEAAISTAALYHYMRTKEDLLVALMTDRMQRIIDAATIARDEYPDAARRLVGLVRVHVVAHARFPDGVVDNEVRSLGPETRPRIIALRDEYQALWEGVLDDGRAQGVFELEEPRLAKLALLEMCNGVVHWYSPRGAADLDRVADAFAGMALALTGASRAGSRLRLADLDLPPASRYLAIVTGAYRDAI